MSETRESGVSFDGVNLHKAHNLLRESFYGDVGEFVLSILDPENDDREAAHEMLDALLDSKKPYIDLHNKVQTTQSRNLF